MDRILELPDGTRFQVLAPVVRGRKGEYEGLLESGVAQVLGQAGVFGELPVLAVDRDEEAGAHEVQDQA